MAREGPVVCVVGTRPEAIKMAPVVRALRRRIADRPVLLLATGQHRDLLDRALADFGLRPDDDLDLMRPGQTLAEVTARALIALDGWLERNRPALVLAQGDTTTVLATALACHYRRVPFGHVEAGLRTGQLDAPFPEEANRVLAGRLAALHFAPTAAAARQLRREGVDRSTVVVTGNPVIDALLWTARRAGPLPCRPATARYALVTAHRRESFGAPLEGICRGLLVALADDPGLSLVVPVHPNPEVRAAIHRMLGQHPRVILLGPQGYRPFVALMKGAWVVLTDSGGVQEEAPALGKPVLVLRDVTERPEAVAAGVARLVGTDPQAIADGIAALADAPPPAVSPYGDGRAGPRIARAVERWLAGRPVAPRRARIAPR